VNRNRTNCLLAICTLFLAACRSEPPAVTDSNDTRVAVAVEYVGAPELKVYARPDAASPLLTSYQNGETVSVLSRRGEWAEVRTATGSGWARASELQGAAAKTTEADNITPRFRKLPAPITQTTGHGEIVLEANVSGEGDIITVRTILNTTGSTALEYKNSQELQHSKFYPMIQHGRHMPFIYEYRVHY
jgi:hypothetical protein